LSFNQKPATINSLSQPELAGKNLKKRTPNGMKNWSKKSMKKFVKIWKSTEKL
jgi:hypothetical protein